MASLISPRSLAPSLFLFFFFFSFAIEYDGRSLYRKYCASCHHEDRIGRTAPPLLPQTLRKKTDDHLIGVIRNGLPATNMPPFPFLSEKQLRSILSFLRSEAEDIRYSLEDIKRSYTHFGGKSAGNPTIPPEALTVAVDKGAGKVLVLEGTKVIDSFSMKNVHGGVKFSAGGKRFYVPARDGWVLLYDLSKGRVLSRVRACIYLRNISLLERANVLAVSCSLPPSLVLTDTELRPIKKVGFEGRPSAVYTLNKKGVFIVAFRDTTSIVLVSREGETRYIQVEFPLEDFFIDPLEKTLVGTSRTLSKLVVYSTDSFKKLYEHRLPSMPHLFSSGFWYAGGDFFFATRHIGSTKLSVWRMYDWKLVKTVDVGGEGFFVRTSPGVPYLWVDTSDGSYTVIDKRTLRVERHPLGEGERVSHVEFSPDGKFAYLSIVGNKQELRIINPLTMEILKEIPMKHPAGKYNFLLKTRAHFPSLLGREVFMTKCWGCHHYTREAFGPPMKKIAMIRNKAQILSQLLNPEGTAPKLGYKRSAMPRIELSPEEIEVLLALVESFKEGGEVSHAEAE